MGGLPHSLGRRRLRTERSGGVEACPEQLRRLSRVSAASIFKTYIYFAHFFFLIAIVLKRYYGKSDYEFSLCGKIPNIYK